MNVLGVEAGNGVLLYPLKKHLMGNIETRAIFHTKGNEQWRINFEDIPYYKTIEEIRYGVKDRVDVILGNPDCGHSSMLSYSRRKSLSDPRDNVSLNLYIKCVKKYKPKIFLMENLPKLLDICDTNFWEKTFPEYSFNFHISSVSEWGNSQKSRVRLIIMGIKTELAHDPNTNIQYHFTEIYKVHKLKSTGELLKGLDKEDIEFGHVREDINSIITLYAGFKIALKDVQKFWKENPEISRWVVKNKKFSTAPGVYRNTKNKYPSTARKCNRQFNPEGLQMSPRELARIQGVPDEFKLYIDPENIQYCINKARATVTKTPPWEIGQWFYNQLITLKIPWK
jgi:site-specific DNA-cytosine methylase